MRSEDIEYCFDNEDTPFSNSKNDQAQEQDVEMEDSDDSQANNGHDSQSN